MRLFEGTAFDIPPRCDICEKLEKECQCPPAESNLVDSVPFDKQPLKIFPERRKHGRMVTCIKGVHPGNIADVLTQLKDRFGCGGTKQGTLIELQGDHAEPAREFLKKIGFKINR